MFYSVFVSGSLYSPEQVHIAWTDDDSAMSVTWAAEVKSSGASVEYTPIASHNLRAQKYAFSSLGI